MDLDSLSKAERSLWEAFPRRDLVDLGGARGSARNVRAEVIGALLLGTAPPEPGRIGAVRLDGARITGALNLGHSVISAPLWLRGCEFDSAINLSGAHTRDLDFDGSRLTGLAAPLAAIDGNLSITGCECSGQVVLTGAHIAGALQMQELRLDHPGKVALLANRLVIENDLFAERAVLNGELRLTGAQVGGMICMDRAVIRGGGRRAFNASNLSVGVDLWARFGFIAEGDVALSGANIGRGFDFRGAELRSPGGTALMARGIQVGGYLSFEDGFTAHGAIIMSRAKVGAGLYLGGRFLNPGGDAIDYRNGDAMMLVLRRDVAADGIVDLRFSKFTVIRDDQSCWPRQLRLSGMDYEALDPQLPPAARVEWLRRDIDGYLPRNYETLAGMYRRQGDDVAARTVLLARERQHREQLPWYGRAWSWLQEVTVGYGYRPLRAGIWLAGFLSVGTLVFGLHHPPALSGVAHPAFNPLIYTLDLMVPLVDLGLRDTYDPQGPERWLAYLLIAVGWIFVTTIATGIARVLRRQ